MSENMRVPFVRPIIKYDESLWDDVRKILDSGHLSNFGPYHQEFERRLLQYLGASFGTLTCNASLALYSGIKALGLRGKVILPSFTYIATLSCVINNNLEPLFADICPDRLTINPQHVATLLQKHDDVAAIIAVNAYGNHADIDGLKKAIGSRSIPLLYDNAHGFGSLYHGSRITPGVTWEVFSFHATKVLPAVEGGFLVSQDKDLVERVGILTNHGLNIKAPLQSMPALNGKMTEFSALIGMVSLDKIDTILENRKKYANQIRSFLSTNLKDLAQLQQLQEGCQSNFQNFPVLFTVNRDFTVDDVSAFLAERNVYGKRYFYPPLHLLEMFKEKRLSLKHTEHVTDRLLCIPFLSYFKPEQLDKLYDALVDLKDKCYARE